MSNNKSQISPIPPEGYGDRFVKFITGITKPREEVERERPVTQHGPCTPEDQSNAPIQSMSTDTVMAEAERQAEKSGSSKGETPSRTLSAARSPSAERGEKATGTTLPILEEVGESGSTGGRSTGGRSTRSREERDDRRNESQPHTPTRNSVVSPPLGGQPPPTPPRDTAVADKEVPSLPALSSLDSKAPICLLPREDLGTDVLGQ